MKRFFLCATSGLMAVAGVLTLAANLILPMLLFWFMYIAECDLQSILDLAKDALGDLTSYHMIAAGIIADIALCLWVTPSLADSYAYKTQSKAWVRTLFAVVTTVFTAIALLGLHVPFKWAFLTLFLPLCFLIFSYLYKEVQE